jgi:hypothetical protein
VTRHPTPESWQKEIILPLHKKGNVVDCKNDRGTHLLNSSYKVYTNIIKNCTLTTKIK